MQTKMEITQKQIEFIIYFQNSILPNRNNVSFDALQYAGSLVGVPVNTSCRTCAQKSGVDLLNLYTSLLPVYTDFLKKKEEETNPTPVVEKKSVPDVEILEVTKDNIDEIIMEAKTKKK